MSQVKLILVESIHSLGEAGDIIVERCPGGLRFHLHEGAFGGARKQEFEVDGLLGSADLAEAAPPAARKDKIDQQFEILPGQQSHQGNDRCGQGAFCLFGCRHLWR